MVKNGIDKVSTDQYNLDMTIYAKNRRVVFDYFIEDQIQVGIKLLGWEVRSIRDGCVSINESYVSIVNNELFLIGSTISPSFVTPFESPDTTRSRKLLATRAQINKFHKAVKLSGFTMMISDLHLSGGFIKANLCLCKGKKLFDKKAAIKERDILRSENQY